MKVEMSAETYQVGAHFKALIKAILVAPSEILEIFFGSFLVMYLFGVFLALLSFEEAESGVIGISWSLSSSSSSRLFLSGKGVPAIVRRE